MTKLENWSLTKGFYQPASPEERPIRLMGIVTDHPNPQIIDGKEVRTSAPYFKTKGGKIMTATGTIYQLGKVDPEYAKQFIYSRRRLLDSLEEYVSPEGK